MYLIQMIISIMFFSITALEILGNDKKYIGKTKKYMGPYNNKTSEGS